MNIFVLDNNPETAAKMMCDKHVVKMVTESAQMLSTAHRVLDGTFTKRPSNSGKRMIPYWVLPDTRERVLFKATMMKHPCTLWAMESGKNYMWLYDHYKYLAREYTYRYGKKHGSFNKSTKIGSYLISTPYNIKHKHQTPFPIAMSHYPECIVESDPVKSYRNYYVQAKKTFATWTKRETPTWFKNMA